ncbi:MAG: right-handed parallel beta-helix repeat-containing protein, partial [candidate division Zixibacteria bacterium]
MKVTDIKIFPLLVLAIMMLVYGAAYGTTRLVPSQYAEIQWAILASSDGDTVMVAPGYYPEEIAFYRIIVVVISSGGAEVTTIDAQASGVPTVTFQSCLPGAELNGFTVTGSDYTGILVNYSSPRILNNIIEYNSSNNGNNGGGIDLNYSTSSMIRKNIIRDNSARTYGAAIHTEYSTNDTICYNLIYDNYGYTEIRCLNTTAAIYNNTIDGAGSRWSGISNQLSGTLDCRNNIIVNMVANGIYGGGPGTGYVVASYNDIYNCAGGAFGGPYVTQGPGNIFVDPDFWGTPPGTPEEYDITPFSSCVDAGDPNPFYNDRDGSRNDMGWRDAFYDIPVLYVPGDYATIQGAINAAPNDYTIVVFPGIYNENIDLLGKRIAIYGDDGPESTTIDASNANIATVKISSSEPKGTVLSGFTITGSNITGVYCYGSSAEISNNIIENNSSNYMNNGGGIDLNYTSSSVIRDNIIRDNSARTYGAAIHTEYSTNDTICYNLMYDNYGYTEIRCLNTTAAIYNNTIDGAGSRWSGISNQLSGTLDCRDNIIVNMVANGIYGGGPGT